MKTQQGIQRFKLLSEGWERIPQSQKLWGISAGILLISLGIGFSGIYSPWKQKREALQKKQQEEMARSQLLSTIQLQKSQLEKNQETLLVPGGTAALTGIVSRLASEADLNVESVAPQPEISFGPYTRFQIRVEANSTYANLMKFLTFVENHRPLLKVDRLELGSFHSLGESSLSKPREKTQGQELLESASPLRKFQLLISCFASSEVSS